MYPTVSSTVLSTFDCREVNGVSYLVSDVSLRCHEGDWGFHSVYAGIMIAIYPIGIPLLLFLIMYRKRAVLYTSMYLKIALGFTFEAYRKGLWWVEIVDMMHKLILTSFLRLIPDPVWALRIGLAVSSVYLISILLVSPFIA